MALTDFTLTTGPDGTTFTMDGAPVGAHRVVIDTDGPVPTITVWASGTVQGCGVVQVVTEPTAAQIDAAAVEAIRRVDVEEFTARCEQKIRAGRRDPYRVALETLVEMADG